MKKYTVLSTVEIHGQKYRRTGKQLAAGPVAAMRQEVKYRWESAGTTSVQVFDAKLLDD